MVARLVRDQKVVGSSPVASTKKCRTPTGVLHFFVSVMSFVETTHYRGGTRVMPANDGWKEYESCRHHDALPRVLACEKRQIPVANKISFQIVKNTIANNATVFYLFFSNNSSNDTSK